MAKVQMHRGHVVTIPRLAAARSGSALARDDMIGCFRWVMAEGRTWRRRPLEPRFHHEHCARNAPVDSPAARLRRRARRGGAGACVIAAKLSDEGGALPR